MGSRGDPPRSEMEVAGPGWSAVAGAAIRDDDLDGHELGVLIEVSAVRRLVRRGISPMDRATLDRLCAAAAAAAVRQDVAAYRHVDRAFRRFLLAADGAPELIDLVDLLGADRLLDRHDRSSVLRVLGEGSREYLWLVDCLLDGNENRAGELMCRHILRMRGGDPS
jgi:DNA-binding GntR family transcriptional regulator